MSVDKEEKRFYRKTNHACRICFARVFAYVDEAGEHHVECSNCGLTKHSHKPETICACGYKLRAKGKAASKWPNAGFRCQLNPNITPEIPSQIIVVHQGDSQ
ncbi:hypothetical protein [Propionivibrio sp.]|uniref:hypothetical protein n=1 Tax=Propionivibrio sp. TaxID=2212460 RepID=UPI003BF188C2